MSVVPNPILSKKRKEDTNYKVGYKCSNCIHFLPVPGTGMPSKCELVEGNISPDAVCDLWEISENSKPYDKEFYMKEAQRMGLNG